MAEIDNLFKCNPPLGPQILEAIHLLEACGYSVTKPRPKPARYDSFGIKLNAVGKPFSPQYDPNYKCTMQLTSIERLFERQNFPWVEP